MYRAACRILGQPAEAEDCVHDVFVEVMSRRETSAVRNWPAYLRWLTTVRSLDRLRRRGKRREIERAALDTMASSLQGPAEAVRTAELREWLRSALTELSPREAEVFALRHFGEMSYDEIASVVGIKRNAVGVALHQARRRLQTMLPTDWLED